MFVYCDNAATTPICRPALDAMLPWLENYGNASSMYKMAREAKTALEDAREAVAGCLNVPPETIYFTSGGTESINWAIKSGVLRHPGRKHIITSAIEHHAVQHTVQFLESQGYEAAYLPVDKHGFVSADDLRAAIRPDTALVSVMTANNEIGTVLDIALLSRAVKEIDNKILFHTDAVQAIGHIPVLITPDIDMLSLSAHKFGGPKGVGALYIRKGPALTPLLHGGGHERGRRSSTENIAGIVSMAAALDYATRNMTDSIEKCTALRDRLIRGILETIPYSHLTGAPGGGQSGKHRLPGNASFVFEAVEGESLVLGLDAKGVCVSSGSACSSASLDPSHVLLAIGLPHEIAHGSLRLTIADTHTEEEMDYVIESVRAVVERCRFISPLWDAKENCPTERFWDR